VTLAQLGDLLESRREPCQLAASAQALHGLELLVRGPAGPNEICMVGIRQAIRPGARGGHDCAFFEKQNGRVCAGERECVCDRFDSFRIGDSVTPAIEHPQVDSLLIRNTRDELGSFELRTPDLEMWRARAAERAAAE
jgi:hypothetical protein